MSRDDKEIPEELYQKDFGGSELEKHKEKRRDEKIVAMTVNGFLLAILGPSVLASVGLIVAVLYYMR